MHSETRLDYAKMVVDQITRPGVLLTERKPSAFRKGKSWHLKFHGPVTGLQKGVWALIVLHTIQVT